MSGTEKEASHVFSGVNAAGSDDLKDKNVFDAFDEGYRPSSSNVPCVALSAFTSDVDTFTSSPVVPYKAPLEESFSPTSASFDSEQTDQQTSHICNYYHFIKNQQAVIGDSENSDNSVSNEQDQLPVPVLATRPPTKVRRDSIAKGKLGSTEKLTEEEIAIENKRLEKLKLVINEVLTTEETYYSRLKVVWEIYIIPLKQLNKLKNEDMNCIFFMWENLIAIHKEFYNLMVTYNNENRLEVEIGPLFSKYRFVFLFMVLFVYKYTDTVQIEIHNLYVLILGFGCRLCFFCNPHRSLDFDH
jgi:hypothetical protein